MRRTAVGLVLVAAFLVLPAAAALAQTFPPPQGFVSDFARMLSPAVRQHLETQLSQLEQSTGAEVAVVTVDSLQGTTVEDYAVRLFESWKIGKKGKDNGVLFLIAQNDRKVRIEVGYGLEPIITDGRAGRILDNQVLPSFREGRYEEGIVAGTAAIVDYVANGTPPAPLEENPIRNALNFTWLLFSMALDVTWFLFLLALVTMYLAGFMARSRSIWLGGIVGALVGVFLGLMMGSLLAFIVVPFVSSAIGFLLDFILSRNYKVRSARGHRTDWWGSGGGFWGPWWRGGGGGFGGFGGFGGGGSGGGGASRGW